MELNKPEIQGMIERLLVKIVEADVAQAKATDIVCDLRRKMPGVRELECEANGNGTATLYINGEEIRLSDEDVHTGRAVEKIAKVLKRSPSGDAALDELIETTRIVITGRFWSPAYAYECLRDALSKYDAQQKAKEAK